jgi:hypothetical protein
MWSGLTVLMCILANFGQVTQYRAELTNDAKYILQQSEVVQARLTMVKQ